MKDWLMLHLVPISAVVSAGVTFCSTKVGPWARKEVASLDAEGLSEIKDPTVRAFAVSVEKAVDQAIPDGGDAKYAQLTDMIMKQLPPEAVLARPVVLALLSGLGTAAKQGLEDAAGGQ